MNSKSLIMAGMVLGSTIGSYLPTLWGAGWFSMTSILLSFIGGALGIWVSYKITRNI